MVFGIQGLFALCLAVQCMKQTRCRELSTGKFMSHSEIQTFLDKNPCCSWQVGCLRQRHRDYEEFFTDYEKIPYRKEPNVLGSLHHIAFKGMQLVA